ncbi:hypothetical protein DBV15_00229 [Temnothorax longispinosus]|uniref:Uncharacterized protein n=1 Tax=Temnothorax longispinosus TaxID=300112 RepID=A0A4S2KHY6_9HYME|nr:hypothetical protein DBV15_00229 [Temnothorax longispinosus]
MWGHALHRCSFSRRLINHRERSPFQADLARAASPRESIGGSTVNAGGTPKEPGVSRNVIIHGLAAEYLLATTDRIKTDKNIRTP